MEDSKLKEVEDAIKRVEQEIAEVVRRLKPLEEKEEKGGLTEKEEKRLDALRKEKEQLRKKEEQLRDKELLLLRGASAGPNGEVVAALQKLSLTVDQRLSSVGMSNRHTNELRLKASVGTVSESEVWTSHQVEICKQYPWSACEKKDSDVSFFHLTELENSSIPEKKAKATGGVTVQSVWRAEQERWNKERRGLQLGFEKAVIGESSTIPDCCGFRRGTALTSMSVQIVGELKGRRESASFTDSERGQLLSYLLKMVKHQSQWEMRSYDAGFLSDGFYIFFLWYLRDARKWFQSDVLLLSDEATRRVFIGLLETGTENAVVSFQDHVASPKRLLGEGATSHVFCVEWKQKEHVLKRFFPSKLSFYDAEVANLKLCEKVPNVTKLIAENRADLMLLLEPIGTRFASDNLLTKSLLLQLIDVISAVHTCGLVHRDIKIENVFSVDGMILLNDFGHAVKIGEEHRAGGCIHNACDKVLTAWRDGDMYRVEPNDDWIMLVRMCWRYSRRGPHLGSCDYEALKTFYDEMSGLWKDIDKKIKISQHCDVSMIRSFFEQVWTM
jgi:hypothetical protein